MPFRGVSLMDQRGAFVLAARIAGANVRELCRTYAISPTTGYKWLDRAGVGAAGGLADRSRRPHRSPRRTAAELEAAVVASAQRAALPTPSRTSLPSMLPAS